MNATVLVVDDEPTYRALYTQVLTEAGLAVLSASGAAEASAVLRAQRIDMVVSDVRMPGGSGLDLLKTVRTTTPNLPFLLVTAYADVRDAVEALKLGAVDYLAKPVDLDELLASVEHTLGITTETTAEDPPAAARGEIICESSAMRQLLRDAWQIAQSDVGALLLGESGTGKEVLARFIHRNSARAKAPFVAVNCAALSASLLASELFGHERGSFTGANTSRRGRFREADGGVLFLDEIGDMPLELQPVLLRALERRAVTPVGGSGEEPTDFRLLAATNRPLDADVAAGRFRADLFYRLNVIALELPPLRERVEDILPLARGFLAAAGGPSRRISRAAKLHLEHHDWPGNVRELHNAMARAHLLARADVILPEHLPPVVRAATEESRQSVPAAVPDEATPAEPDGTNASLGTLQESEIASLKRALKATSGNRTHAAALLGISRRGLLKKIKRYALDA